MSKYQIIRWNVVTDCNGIQRPMIYFKPDPTIVLQMQDNNNYLYLDIDQCGLYSGNMVPALIDIASQQPNYRPNFFEACHLFCATLLETPWYGFPTLNQYGQFSVYTGVIIPTCWRANGNCPGTPSHYLPDVPSRHSGDDPSRHSGDDPSRHSGDDPSRHSGDESCTAEDIKTGKCKCMNVTENSKSPCVSGGTTVSDANACKAAKDSDAVYIKDGISKDNTANCYTCDGLSAITGEDYKCKWSPVENFNSLGVYNENKNQISSLTPQQPLQKKTSTGCCSEPVDIIPGVPHDKYKVDYSAAPINYASAKVPADEEANALKINNANKRVGDTNITAEFDATNMKNIVEAEKITREPSASAQNMMYPKFDAQQPVITDLDISPQARYVEAYANSGDSVDNNNLVVGLSVLVALLFIFIIILQLTKNN